MKRIQSKALPFVMIALCAIAGFGQTEPGKTPEPAASKLGSQKSQRIVSVEGYLVDADDRPVQDGVATPYFVPPEVSHSWERLIVAYPTFEDGQFYVEEVWKPGRKILVLMEERPKGFYPIPQEELLSKKYFKGVIISNYSAPRNLGKVRDYIKYGQVVQNVSDPSSQPLLENILNSNIWLRIKDSKGKVVSYGSFKGAYDFSFEGANHEKRKKLAFYLPAGTWFVEMIDYESNQIMMPPTKVVIVQHGTVNI